MSVPLPASERIIVVDDDEFARDVLSSLLRRALPQARVLAAARGEEGLALYREEKPDVVITDLRMTGMSGAELIAAIREVDATTPIFVITGAPDSVAVPGATEVILKTEFRYLIERVTSVVRRPDLKAQAG